jgi:hypothetical protein
MSSPHDDVGAADLELVAALDSGDVGRIRQRLLLARVLVPIVALGEESTAVEMAVPQPAGADVGGAGDWCRDRGTL